MSTRHVNGNFINFLEQEEPSRLEFLKQMTKIWVLALCVVHAMCVAPVFFYSVENYPMHRTRHVHRNTQPMRRALQLQHIFGLQRDFFTPPWFVFVSLMYLRVKLDYGTQTYLLWQGFWFLIWVHPLLQFLEPLTLRSNYILLDLWFLDLNDESCLFLKG